jgi:nitrate reductase delta subunit
MPLNDLIALRALSALITYPRPELIAALPEIDAVLTSSRLLPRAEREWLNALIAEMRAADPTDLEGRYVELFDRGRRTSLHAFEHIHGESRDRGAAMVELNQIYANAGYHLAARELPDYLPVILEYLSCRNLAEARAMLGDCAHVLRSIGEALMQRGSSYAAVFAALLAVAQEPGLDGSKAGEAPSREPLDEDWAEIPAFAPADAGRAAEAAQVAPIRFVSRKLLP